MTTPTETVEIPARPAWRDGRSAVIDTVIGRVVGSQHGDDPCLDAVSTSLTHTLYLSSEVSRGVEAIDRALRDTVSAARSDLWSLHRDGVIPGTGASSRAVTAQRELEQAGSRLQGLIDATVATAYARSDSAQPNPVWWGWVINGDAVERQAGDTLERIPPGGQALWI